jgi:hypothetical protein
MPEQIIVGDQNSCRCDPAPAANIPGTPGQDGAPGAAGAPGVNAWASLTDSFTMPAQGATGTADFDHTDWLAPGEPVWVEFLGTLLVESIAGLVVTLRNLQDGSGAYPLNAAPGTVSPSTSRITPTGFEGQAGTLSGAAGGDLVGNYPNPLLKATGTAGTTGDATHVARITTDANGRVTAATAVAITFPPTVIPTGIANAQFAPNDGALTPGDSIWATAAGIQTKTQAQALLALGITTGTSFLYALLQDQHPSATESGALGAAAWTKVPVNTEVSDPGNIVTLAGSVVTLATGTYRIRAKVLGYQIDKFQTRLWNDSDGTVEFYGTNAAAQNTVLSTSVSFIEGRLVVAGGPKNYELQARSQTANGLNAFGPACGSGATEVYTTWEIGKEV